MTKQRAFNLLLAGYIIALLGGICGVLWNVIEGNPFGSFLYMMYMAWSAYWGVQIVYHPLNNFFANMFILDTNLIRLFFHYLMKRVLLLIIIFVIGIFIGCAGGAIYKQIKLSPIAYR